MTSCTFSQVNQGVLLTILDPTGNGGTIHHVERSGLTRQPDAFVDLPNAEMAQGMSCLDECLSQGFFTASSSSLRSRTSPLAATAHRKCVSCPCS